MKYHGLTPLQTVDFFDFFRSSPFKSKKYSFLSRISKNLSLWLFLHKKKNIWEKSSMFWQKPWTNLFAKCRFFSTFWELHFWGPKNFMFFPEYQKMFLMAFFAKKKNIWGKGRFFDKNHVLTLCKMSIFFTLLEFQFSGLKSFLYYPELKKCFFLAFLAKKKHIRKQSIFW